MGKYEMYKDAGGGYRFRLKAGNGQIILASESYVRKAGVEGGIQSVKVNSPTDSRYERKQASNGQYMFNLKAANHEIIGTSELYTSSASRENGIESCKENGPDSPIVDLTGE